MGKPVVAVVDYEMGNLRSVWQALVKVAEGRDIEVTADPAVVASLRKAAENVRRYHQEQKPNSWMTYRDQGSILGQSIIPLDRVGIYVPGGTAAYPSSVLMNAVPAKVAGVPEVVMVVPTPRGEINELVLAAAFPDGVPVLHQRLGRNQPAARKTDGLQ